MEDLTAYFERPDTPMPGSPVAKAMRQYLKLHPESQLEGARAVIRERVKGAIGGSLTLTREERLIAGRGRRARSDLGTRLDVSQADGRSRGAS